jgi:hypothetical protein
VVADHFGEVVGGTEIGGTGGLAVGVEVEHDRGDAPRRVVGACRDLVPHARDRLAGNRVRDGEEQGVRTVLGANRSGERAQQCGARNREAHRVVLYVGRVRTNRTDGAIITPPRTAVQRFAGR